MKLDFQRAIYNKNQMTKNHRLGYCCINLTLQESLKITINRGMVKRTFLERGISYASELALANVKDLEKIVKWNHDNGITMYRMSSDMFPWCSEYEIPDLPEELDTLVIINNHIKYLSKHNIDIFIKMQKKNRKLYFINNPFCATFNFEWKYIKSIEQE